MGNKITSRHVNFTAQKMKVKLATQLVSRSTAVALNVLRRSGYPQFQESEGMEEFLLIFDRYGHSLEKIVNDSAYFKILKG